MTSKQIDELAKKIADNIVTQIVNKQKELDKDFIDSIEKSGSSVEILVTNTEIERLELEVYRLRERLNYLELHEKYSEAFSCDKDIKSLLKQIERLKLELM